MREGIRLVGVLALLALSLLGCGGGEEFTEMAPTIDLRSSAFAAEGEIPVVHTCDGGDRSPGLEWDAGPEGTQSWALILEDPDAPAGTFAHWVLYNLPAEVTSLRSAQPPQERLENGALQGRNSARSIGYKGPCPPSGSHRYYWRLYALDTMLDLAPGATARELRQAMQGHVLAQGELMGRYARR